MDEMGIFEKFFQRWQGPELARSDDRRRPDDRALMESIAEFDQDPDVRKAAEELLASGALHMK
jgi:hypothetical protein